MTWLRVLLIVACFAVVKGANVTIRVDDEVQIYLDGEAVYDEFDIPRWQWRELVEIPFSEDARIMAFRMYNQGPRRLGYGKGKIDGQDLFRSGIVCIDVPKRQDPDVVFPGWLEADYDDSEWRPPVAVVSHPTEGILADAQGFWGGPRSSETVLCRLKLDIDECAEGTSGCLHECENLNGTFKCSCNEGFELAEDGKNCTDIDDCADNPCGDHQTCEDGFMTYSCTCDQGYVGANCEFFATRACSDLGNITTFANGTTRVPRSRFCIVELTTRGQDNTSYTLSVDLYKPEGQFHLQVLYNYYDEANTDAFQFETSCAFLAHVVENSKHFTDPGGCIPHGLLAGWFTFKIVVLPDSDFPEVIINGTSFDSGASTFLGPKTAKLATGGLDGSSQRPLHFANFRLE